MPKFSFDFDMVQSSSVPYSPKFPSEIPTMVSRTTLEIPNVTQMTPWSTSEFNISSSELSSVPPSSANSTRSFNSVFDPEPSPLYEIISSPSSRINTGSQHTTFGFSTNSSDFRTPPLSSPNNTHSYSTSNRVREVQLVRPYRRVSVSLEGSHCSQPIIHLSKNGGFRIRIPSGDTSPRALKTSDVLVPGCHKTIIPLSRTSENNIKKVNPGVPRSQSSSSHMSQLSINLSGNSALGISTPESNSNQLSSITSKENNIPDLSNTDTATPQGTHYASLWGSQDSLDENYSPVTPTVPTISLRARRHSTSALITTVNQHRCLDQRIPYCRLASNKILRPTLKPIIRQNSSIINDVSQHTFANPDRGLMRKSPSSHGSDRIPPLSFFPPSNLSNSSEQLNSSRSTTSRYTTQLSTSMSSYPQHTDMQTTCYPQCQNNPESQEESDLMTKETVLDSNYPASDELRFVDSTHLSKSEIAYVDQATGFSDNLMTTSSSGDEEDSDEDDNFFDETVSELSDSDQSELDIYDFSTLDSDYAAWMNIKVKNVRSAEVTSLTSSNVSSDILQEKLQIFNTNKQGLKMKIIDQEENIIEGTMRVFVNFIKPVKMSLKYASNKNGVSNDQGKRKRQMPCGLSTFLLPRGTSKILTFQSSTTAGEAIETLLKKYRIQESTKKFALYEHTIEAEDSVVVRKIEQNEFLLEAFLSWTNDGPENFLNLLKKKRIVLQENDSCDIEWKQFSVPELKTFLRILSKEEKHYRQIISNQYAMLALEIKERLRKHYLTKLEK